MQVVRGYIGGLKWLETRGVRGVEELRGDRCLKSGAKAWTCLHELGVVEMEARVVGGPDDLANVSND